MSFDRLYFEYYRGKCNILLKLFGAIPPQRSMIIEVPWSYPNNLLVIKDLKHKKIPDSLLKDVLRYPTFNQLKQEIQRVERVQPVIAYTLKKLKEVIEIDYELYPEWFEGASKDLSNYVDQQLDIFVKGGSAYLKSAMWFQRVVAFISVLTRRFGIFFEQGLGKTKTATDIMNLLFKKYKDTRVLVVCPPGLVKNWYNELLNKKLNPRADIIKILMFQGSKTKKEGLVKTIKTKKHDIVIAGSSTLPYLKDHMDEFGFTTIFIDESHTAKNMKTNVTKNLLEMVRNLTFRYILTGTPVLNEPADLYAQMNILGDIFPERIDSFKNKYMHPHPYIRGRYMGHRNMPHLFNRIKYVSIAVEKKQLLRDLKERTVREVLFKMPEEQLRVFKMVMDKNVENVYVNRDKKLKKTITLVANVYGRMISGGSITYLDVTKEKVEKKLKMDVETFCGHCKMREACLRYAKRIMKDILPLSYECLIRSDLVGKDKPYKNDADLKSRFFFKENPKIKWLRNFIHENPGLKIIVFCEFIPELNKIEEMLNEESIGYARLDGSNTSHRIDIVNEFQANQKKQVLISQIATAIGYTANAIHTSVYYSVGNSLGNFKQSRDRIYRKGQKSAVTEYHLIMDKSLERKIWNNMETKNKVKNLATKNREKDIYVETVEKIKEIYS